MKKKVRTVCIILILVGGSAFTLADSIIRQLGLSHQVAQQYILNNIIGDFRHEPVDVGIVEDGGGAGPVYNQFNSFQLPRITLSDMIQGDKTKAAKELCGYIKQYVNSEEFVTAYAKAREAAKPGTEPYRMDAAAIAGLKKSLQEMEAGLAKMKTAKMPATTLQQMEEGIAIQKKMIAAQSDPTPNKTKWNQLYPANPVDAVKARLQEYLSVAATVDFAATTNSSGKKKVFTNAAYENKSLQWKAIYRAGKEVNTVVTAFMNEWIREGVMKGPKITMTGLYKEENGQ